MADPRPDPTGYPPAPWAMTGQLWLSLFRLRDPVGDRRPAGLYAAAFVRYEPESPLTYAELLVARPVAIDAPGRGVSVTDIWVDSPASAAGGRELWAIPKELGDFHLESRRRGPLTSTEWSASRARRPIAAASFTDVSRAAVRVPFRGGIRQPGIPDSAGEERTAALRGSARTLPCRGRWDFAADGPLGWLRGARPLGSFRMADFRISIG